MRYLVNAKVWAIALALVALSGCGGGSKGADGTSGANGSNGQTALVNLEPLAVGSSSCANGGVNVQSGLDTNSNAKLEANEVQSKQPICNGANGVGANGVAPSIRINTSAFDGNNNGCTTGGTDIAITVGSDPAIHSYLCNGTQGAQGIPGVKGDTGDKGSDGSPGTNGLSAVVTSIRGNGQSGTDNSACAVTGGVSVTVGNSSIPSYVCNGNQVVLSTAPTNACRYGGVQISISTSSTPQTVCNGNMVPWVDVQDTYQQALRNTGYLARSSSLTTIQLPDPYLVNVGDIVKVSGVGAGGWKIDQNAGQKIYTGRLGARGIVSQQLLVDSPYVNSPDYHYAIALAQGGSPIYTAAGQTLFKSIDSGQTWAELTNALNLSGTNASFQAIAASPDGKNVVTAGAGTDVYVSNDFGASWHATGAPYTAFSRWTALWISTDGANLVALDSNGAGAIYSTDSGANWQRSAGISGSLRSTLPYASDAQYLFAAAGNGGVYVSQDFGSSWNNLTPPAGLRVATSIATSADGNRLVVTDKSGGVYVSQDAGFSWTKTSLPDVGWSTSAMSADGKTILVSGDTGGTGVYTSEDYGVTWRKSTVPDASVYVALATTANGLKWFGATESNANGLVGYGSIPYTSLGSGGSLSGDQYDAVELQYTGGGVFTILNSASFAGLRAR